VLLSLGRWALGVGAVAHEQELTALRPRAEWTPSLLLCACLPLRSTSQRNSPSQGLILRCQRMRSTVRSTATSSRQRAQWHSQSAAKTRMSLLLRLEHRQRSAISPLRQAIEIRTSASALMRSNWNGSCALCCLGMLRTGSHHRGTRAADLKASAASVFRDSALIVTLELGALNELTRGSGCLLSPSTRTRRGRARPAANLSAQRRPLRHRPGRRTFPIGIVAQGESGHGVRSRRCPSTN